jgi:hypothetical protein
MIRSLWKIEFVTTGGTFLLLDVGDFISGEISPKVSQQAETYSAIGAAWGKTQAQGTAVTSLAWSTRRDHDSHAGLRAFCMRHAAAFPGGLSGALRISIEDGEVWNIADASLASSEPMPLAPSGGFRTITSYTATGGSISPASAIPLYPGIPWAWILQDWTALTGDWDAI